MITLYTYPELFQLPDNNPFGLKVDTFLRLTKIPYKLEHLLSTEHAPRGQLPYLDDDGVIVSDSNKMIAYLTRRYQIDLDADLTEDQRSTSFLITRMLDYHLYWVMSYSRWQDPHYWPLFKAAFLKQCPGLTAEALELPRNKNIEKYFYQGIGRYEEEDVYQMGVDNLRVIHKLLGHQAFLFGNSMHTVDASCYGFLANIFYFEIDTPLKQFIVANSTLAEYVTRMRARLGY